MQPWRTHLRTGAAFALTLALVVLSITLASTGRADPDEGLPHVASGTTLDRSTPRRTLSGMLAAVHDGEPARAAHYLDLRGIPRSQQLDRGPKLARSLAYVLSHENVDIDHLPDTPTVPPPPGTSAKSADANLVSAGDLYIGEEPVAISLVRVRFDDGVYRWLVSRTTLSMVDELNDAFGPKEWQTHLPEWLTRPVLFGNVLWQWLALAALAFAAYVIGRGAASTAVWLGLRAAHRARWGADDRLIVTLRRPLRTIVAATVFRALVELLDLTSTALSICSHVAYTLLVIALAWLLVRVLGVAAAWVQERALVGQAEEYKSRGVRTQLALIQRLASVVVTIVAMAVVALQFQLVRNVGLSLLASAGILSVVIGFAAQKSLAGIIAGIQLFIAQPVRIGDSVEMEGESGVMEEMNLTYAVVKLWDGRRLVVPITKLLDTSFKNLSFAHAVLLGAVELVVDPATPVEAVRGQLATICKASPEWDGKTCLLHVTGASEKGMTLRALVAATDSRKLFDLQSLVREKLLAFLRDLESGRYYANQRHAPIAAAALPIKSPLGSASA